MIGHDRPDPSEINSRAQDENTRVDGYTNTRQIIFRDGAVAMDAAIMHRHRWKLWIRAKHDLGQPIVTASRRTAKDY